MRYRLRSVLEHLAATVPVVAATLWIVGVRVGMRSLPWWEPVLAAAAVAAVLGQGGRAAAPPAQAAAGLLSAACLARWFAPGELGAFLRGAPVASLYGALFLRACLGFASGRDPFTVYYARRTTPKVVWNTDLFRRINREMSLAWTVLFAGAAGFSVSSLLAPPGAPRVWFGDVLPAALVAGIGVPLNRCYPGWRRRKAGVALPSDRPGPPEKESTMTSKTVVAVNGSPHEGVGNTSEMIGRLRAHLAPLGVGLDEIFLTRHEIGYCIGCGRCLERGGCWIRDDHAGIVQRLLDADGVILASPVYIDHVTAQMKTFLDRCLPLGHKPRTGWKPGLAVSVSAGLGETGTAAYLAGALRVFGAYPVGALTAIAVAPGAFVGERAVDAHAADLARDLAAAVGGERRRPATDRDLRFWQFMGGLVRENREFMRADFAHWDENGLFQGFERYVGQDRSPGVLDPAAREAWIAEAQRAARSGRAVTVGKSPGGTPGAAASTCTELLRTMPAAFDPAEAQGLDAVYQFEIEDEGTTAHLTISGGRCTFHEGPAAAPDVVIRTPGAVWLAIARGDLDGQRAFMAGRYRVDGDLALLMRLPRLFASPPAGTRPAGPW